MHVLAEIVDQRRAVIEHRITRIGFRQTDFSVSSVDACAG
jgi:hypothetical protein